MCLLFACFAVHSAGVAALASRQFELTEGTREQSMGGRLGIVGVVDGQILLGMGACTC